jgi:hypothetical protein
MSLDPGVLQDVECTGISTCTWQNALLVLGVDWPKDSAGTQRLSVLVGPTSPHMDDQVVTFTPEMVKPVVLQPG